MPATVLNLYFKSPLNPLPIGQLSIDDPGRDHSACYFVYDPQWLEIGYCISNDLPLIPKVFKTDLTHPYFGFMYDLIPGIGARKAARFKAKKDLTNIELLLQSQETLRPGAIGLGQNIQVPLQHKQIGAVALDLERLMMGHLNISDIDSLYNALSALPGDRFKLAYQSGKNKNIISKFNIPDPNRNLIIWEGITLSLAKRLGLSTVTAELTSTRGMDTLVSLRFDRTAKGEPIGFATAKAILAAHDDEHSYLEVADILNQDGAKPKSDLLELWRRMVFNMCVGNTHDTLDNIAFIRERDGWRLAPLYSLQPEPLSVSRRHHATAVTEDCDRPDLAKAVEVCPYFGLSKRKAEQEALNISSFCAHNWEKVAREFQADPIEIDNMRKAFEQLEL